MFRWTWARPSAVWARRSVWAVDARARSSSPTRGSTRPSSTTSHDGLRLGLSRVVVYTNWPVGARRDRARADRGHDALPRRAWWLAGPALALCATMPLFVSQAHLNARWGNADPRRRGRDRVGLTLCRRAAGRGIVRAAASGRSRCGSSSRPSCSCSRCPGSRPSWASHLPGSVFMGGELFPTGRDSFEAAFTSASTTAGTARSCCSRRSRSPACRRPAGSCWLLGRAAASRPTGHQRRPGLLERAARQARHGRLGDPTRSCRAVLGLARGRHARHDPRARLAELARRLAV